MAQKTDLGMLAKSFMDKGELVPDSLILDMMEDRLAKSDCGNGYILDGFPRTTPQAEGLTVLLKKLNHNLDKVIVLNVEDDSIVERMSGRRVHLPSGRVYHIKFNPPKKHDLDDVTNEKLTIRKDDEESTVRKRLSIYHDLTKPLIEFYKDNSVIINGTQDIDKVFNDITKSLK